MIRALCETLGRHYEVHNRGSRIFGFIVGCFWTTAARFSVGYVDGKLNDG
jgi:hypothetical protein